MLPRTATKTWRCNTGNQVIRNSRFGNQGAIGNLWLPHAIIQEFTWYWWFSHDVIKNMIMQNINFPQILV